MSRLFTDLLVESLSESDFLNAFPKPALVIEPIEEGDSGNIRSPVTVAPDDPGVPGGSWIPMPGWAHPKAKVEWLVKSDRNPFSGFLTLGRARNNDIIVNSATVSKIHVYLTERDGSWWIEDKGTTNGTQLEGDRLAPRVVARLEDRAALILGTDTGARFFQPRALYQFCQAVRASGSMTP